MQSKLNESTLIERPYYGCDRHQGLSFFGKFWVMDWTDLEVVIIFNLLILRFFQFYKTLGHFGNVKTRVCHATGEGQQVAQLCRKIGHLVG